jgi:hypothetical protein
MKKISSLIIAFFSFFTPIELCVLLLFFMMIIDTLVKLVSLKKIAKKENRPFRDVFKSGMLRKGYIYKGAGYFLFALAVFPVDFYALTPFIDGSIKYFGLNIVLPTTAICTNFLLIIFCLIELSSINENYFDITGNNIMKSVWSMTKKIREVIQGFTGFIKETKNDL